MTPEQIAKIREQIEAGRDEAKALICGDADCVVDKAVTSILLRLDEIERLLPAAG